MNSNFNFLKNDPLTADYYPSAVQAEKSLDFCFSPPYINCNIK